MKNPYDIAKWKRLSTSFVSSKQRRNSYCYGRVGFDGKYEKTNAELRKLSLLGPQDIIDDKVLFNQVIVEGTTYCGKIVPIGIFVDYTGIYNEFCNEWERDGTNANLQKLVELSGNIFPIIDIIYRDLSLSKQNY